MANDLHEFLRSKEAGEILRRSDRTLARWRAEGIGPSYYQHRGRVLYERTVLLEWQANNKKVPVRCEP